MDVDHAPPGVEALNINNRWLPYAQDIAATPDVTLAEIVAGLQSVVEREDELDAAAEEEDDDEQGAGGGWNERGVGPHLKKLDSLLALKLKFDQRELGAFLQVAYRLMQSPRLSARSEVKLLRGISALMRQARIEVVWATEPKVELDVMPLYRRLQQEFLGDEEDGVPLQTSTTLFHSLRSAYISALHHLRHYYSADSARQLLQELSPDLEATGLVLPAQSLLLLVGLLPTRLPEGMYDELMPEWMRAWQTIDNCPEWDLLWLRLFCRARKYTRRFDWAAHIPHLLTYLLSTFSLPLGSVPGPEQKRFPSRFRALFQPPIQHYNRLLLLSKLVVFLLGQGGDATVDVPLRPTPPNPEESEDYGRVPCSGAARHLLLLLSTLRTFFNPSNSGQWSDELGVFLSYLSGALARRVGWQAADRDYAYTGGDGGEVLIPPLPERDVTAVVEAILPLAHQCLYSKRSAAIAAGEQTLKTLACLRPASVARLTVPLLVQALDPSSLTTTHQAPAALKALSVIAQPLLVPVPHLLDALPTLLQWSLPGLDSNDLAKTMATVQFYIAVLDWLPLRAAFPQRAKDAVGFARLLPAPPGDPRAGAAEDEGSEEWTMERVAEAAPALADWAMAVLERCQALLVSKEGQRGAGVAKSLMGKFESAQSLIWRYLFRSLFTQMDGELHAQARHSIRSFLRSHTLPDAVKDTAYMLECLAAANPAPTLKELGPGLLLPDPSDAAALPPRTLAWRTRLLANTARFSGAALLPYLSAASGFGSIPALLALTLEHEEKDVRKAGGKLLRRCLQALTEIYPTEYRSFPGSANVDNAAAPFLVPPSSQDNLEMSWHVPTAAEVSAAIALIKRFVVPALEALEQGAKDLGAGSVNSAKQHELEEAWRRRLKILLHGVRGFTALLVEMEDGQGGDDRAVRFGCRLVLAAMDAEARPFLLGLRERLSLALHHLLPALTAEASPLNRDVKVLKTWGKCVRILLLARGASRAHKARGNRQGLQFTKHMVRNWVLEAYRRAARVHEAAGRRQCGPTLGAALPPGYSRRLLVERVHTQHLLRCHEASYRIPRAAREAQQARGGGWAGNGSASALLFQDLIALSAYHISTVRAAAQVYVGSAGMRYPWHLRAALPDLIAALCTGLDAVPNEDTIHQRATAATFLVCQSPSMRQIASSWWLTQKMVRALARSGHMVSSLARDKQETLTLRLSDVAITYIEFFEAPDLTSPKRKAEHAALLTDLLALLRPSLPAQLPSAGAAGPPLEPPSPPSGGGAPLHWRYQLLVLWEVLHLTRPDMESHPAGPAVWDALLAALASGDGQPLQKMALAGLGRFLAWSLPQQGRRPPNSLSRPPSPTGGAGQLLQEYVVLPDPSTEVQDDDDGADEGLGATLADTLSTPAFCRTLCLALAHDHREAGGGDPRWSAGVEEMLKDARAKWGGAMPVTRFHLGSADFVVRHAQLVRALLRGVGPRLIAPLVEAAVGILEGMPTEHERAYYATVGEVVAGLVSEYTRAEVSDGRRARLWAAVLPALEKVLPKLSLDYANELADAFRFMAQQRSPHLLEPIIALLVQRAVASLGGLPAGSAPVAKVAVADDYTAQAKALRFLQPFLIEAAGEPRTRAQGQALAIRLLPSLLSNLGHPYKVVREQIAFFLFLAYGYAGMPLSPPSSSGTASPGSTAAAVAALGDVLAHVRSVAMAEADTTEGLAAATAAQLQVQDEAGGAGAGSAGAATTAQQEEVTRRRETVLRWVLTSVQSGDRVRYARYVLPLLDVVYECVRDREEEVAMLGKHAARFLARALWLKDRVLDDGVGSSVAQLQAALLGLTRHRSWYVKQEAAAALAVFQAEHRALLAEAERQEVLDGLLALLGDERREVQDAAKASLSSLLSASELGAVAQLAERHADAALKAAGAAGGGKGKRRKKEAEAAAAGGAAVAGADAARTPTLLLAALVAAYPYEVPPFLPRALTALARLCDLASPSLQVVVRKTLTDFKRTHQDEWDHRHKLRFTPEELDALADVLVSPHYYA